MSYSKIKEKFELLPVFSFSICVLIFVNLLAYIPVWWDKIDLNPRPYLRSEVEVIRKIPDHTTVAAPVSMFSRLAHRVRLIPSMHPDGLGGFKENADFIIFDENFPQSHFDYKKNIRDFIKQDSPLMNKFDLLFQKDGIYLFGRKKDD